MVGAHNDLGFASLGRILHFFIWLFKRDICHIKESYTAFEKGYGICERACIVAFLFLSKPFIFSILPILLLRPVISVSCWGAIHHTGVFEGMWIAWIGVG